MPTAAGQTVRNWEGSITSHPRIVTQPTTVDDIIDVMQDHDSFPAPVRAVGSNHSTTRCGVADNGTVVEMTKMNRIIEVGADTVTTEAGALYIDVAKELERHNLQFFVNVELGNLSMGSAACGGTKDASMPGEFGQVCSYAIVIKLVTPAGELLEVTEDDPELLQIMRSSYGLLGIVHEVTFRVQPLRPMAVQHVTYSLAQLEQQLTSLIARQESMMLYVYPFLGAVTVEYRKYGLTDGSPNRRVWRIRNWAWKTAAPSFGFWMTKLMPIKPVRYFLFNRFNRIIQFALKTLVNSANTVATDQIIRYPEKSGRSKYTFSIWAFPEQTYIPVLRLYFAFCQEYDRNNGYRCDLLHVGYRISEDTSSLFSYSFGGTVMTIDPVSTGGVEWEGFLAAYNEFCSQNGGIPLFNQTKWLKPEYVRLAFGDRVDKFRTYRERFDPENRLLNEYFRELLN